MAKLIKMVQYQQSIKHKKKCKIVFSDPPFKPKCHVVLGGTVILGGMGVEEAQGVELMCISPKEKRVMVDWPNVADEDCAGGVKWPQS
jgi:16S rRNA G966 N2-methylase RsmD